MKQCNYLLLDYNKVPFNYQKDIKNNKNNHKTYNLIEEKNQEDFFQNVLSLIQ